MATETSVCPGVNFHLKVLRLNVLVLAQDDPQRVQVIAVKI